MKDHRSGARFVLFVAALVIFSGSAYLVQAQTNCTGKQMLTAKTCAGDSNSSEEQTLFQLVNKYRLAHNRPALTLSTSLSTLANRRTLDMRLNMKALTHSWSDCPYNISDQKTWGCMMDSPQRLKTGYPGQGYETLYRTTSGQAQPSLALEAWEKSSLHRSIILNEGMFKDMTWDEVGVAVDGEYAVLWFGHPGGSTGGANSSGIGVSYDRAVAGLSKMLSITQTGTESGKWQGVSADKKIKLEIYGSRKDISEASIAISMKLDAGKLSPQGKTALSTLLKNLFPSWNDRDPWVAAAVAAIAADATASKTKVVDKAFIELSAAGAGTLKLMITPPGTKPKATQIF